MKKIYVSSTLIMSILISIFLIIPIALILFSSAESLTEKFLFYDTKKSDLLYVSKDNFYTLIDENKVDTVYISNEPYKNIQYTDDMYFRTFEDIYPKYYKVVFTEETRLPATELSSLIKSNPNVIFKNLSELIFFEDQAESLKANIVLSHSMLIVLFIVLCCLKSEKDKNKKNADFWEERERRLEKLNSESNFFLGVKKDNCDLETENNENKKYFSDIAGLKEVKKDVKCLVDFIKNKEKYLEAGAKLPKGVILYGPPGTGKTLLAKAIAGEADIPFLYASGSGFMEMYVGVGPKRVRELFNKARKQAPCIIFIDEIDAIGSQRTGHDHSEDRKTLDALLTEMDGFKETENILVIAATNRIEDLDNALLRPGRFTDKYCVPLPETASERMEVIDLYIKNKKLSDDVDLNDLSKETIGYSPAKIEALLNSAAIISVQDGEGIIRKCDIDKAMTKLLLEGHMREDNSERNKEEIKVVAFHEAGHALVGRLFGKDITKVTVIASTSGAGGVTFSIPKEGGLSSAKDLKCQIMELYAGRLAELLYFNEDKELVTTGAYNDIERASRLIDNLLKKYAMSDDFGLLNLKDEENKDIFNCKVEIAKSLEKETLRILKEHRKILDAIAGKLIENETIYKKDVDEIFKIFNV